MSEIEWRDVPGFEGVYQASSEGQIRRHPNAKNNHKSHPKSGDGTLSIRLKQRGYLTCCLQTDGKIRTYLVHRLVAAAFWGSPEGDRTFVNHKNFIKTDNRPENLEWVTPRENVLHAIRGGRHEAPKLRGEDTSNAKLTAEDVRAIRILAKEHTPVEIARRFKVGPAAIYHVITRRNWAHVE
jgi:hypothetical protein